MKKDFRYLHIAHGIECKIQDGVFLPEQKLPSIRQIMSDEHASRTTVEKALNVLVKSGLICARNRSGYYVSKNIDPKRTLNLKKLPKSDAIIADLLVDANESDLTFSTAALHCSLVPEQHLAHLATKAIKRFPNECMRLELPPGSIRFRSAVATHLKSVGIRCGAGDVVVTTGDNSFLRRVLQRLSRRGGQMAMDQVCYFGCLQAIQDFQLRVHKIPSCAASGFDVEYALHLINSGLVNVLVLNPTLCNPLGYTISEKDRIRLVQACDENDCIIVEDDIFCDLQDPSSAVKPIKAWDTKGNVIYLGSLSKVIAPGLRVGWCLPGSRYSQIVGELLSENHAVSSPSQIIASELLGSGLYFDHLKRLRQSFVGQARNLSLIIQESFPRNTKISSPAGGGIFWIELPEGTNTNYFFSKVADTGIKISPGSIFGAARDAPSFRLCVTKKLNLKSKAAIIEIGHIAKESQLAS